MDPSQPQPNPQDNNPPGGQSYSNGQKPLQHPAAPLAAPLQPTQSQPTYQIPTTPIPQQPMTADPMLTRPEPAPQIQPQPIQPAPQAIDPTYQMYVNHLYEQQGLTPPQAETVPEASYTQPPEPMPVHAQPVASEHQQPEPTYPQPQPAQPVPLEQAPVHPTYLPEPQTALSQPAAPIVQPSMPAHQPIQPTPAKQYATYELPGAVQTPTPAAISAPTANAGSLPVESTKAASGNGKKPSKPSLWKPLLKAGLVGLVIIAIFNSQLIVGQIKFLVSPQAEANSSILDDAVSKDSTIVIPKINVKVPVVYDVPGFEEAKIQKALQRGVVHYGSTALPGQPGNGVIVGHSSNNWWASGKYKFAFVLLSKLDEGDLFELHYKKKKFVYQIVKKKIIKPTDLAILDQSKPGSFFTLITCTPPGTSWQRLYVQGKQIEPKPSGKHVTKKDLSKNEKSLPGNTPSLWQQIKERLFGG